MINLIHITAKGMPAAQAAAGQHAPMSVSAVTVRACRNVLGAAFGKEALRRCLQSARLGFSKPETFAYAAVGVDFGNYGSNGFGATNPPFDDNSPGKTRLKLR
jgi:hypothetical protein